MNKNYLIVLAFLSFFISHAQQAGDLDTSFGVNGIVRANEWNATFNVKSHQVLSNGKIVVAGEVNNGVDPRGFLMRLQSNGEIDLTFGSQGKVVHPFLNGFEVVKVQTDGKIVVGSSFQNDYAVARYLENGTLDTGFAYDGTYYDLDGSGNIAYLHKTIDLEIQSDNKIVGLTTTVVVGTNRFVKLFRLNQNGIVDSTLDETDNFNFNYTPTALSIQSDGKILVGGHYGVGASTSVFVARYNSEGFYDSFFGIAGMRTFGLSNATAINTNDMQLQPDGKIIIAGNYFANGTALFVARLNTNGTLDTTFSGDGLQTATINLRLGPGKIALQSDGRIVQMGSFLNQNTSKEDILLVRYTANGELDATFNGTSPAAVLSLNELNDKPGDLSIVNNQLFVSGNTEQTSLTNSMAFIKLNVNPLTLDTTFGTGGFNQISIIHPTYEEVYNSVIQTDNMVVVLNKIFVNNNYFWGIHRYNENGSLDTSFGFSGRIGIGIGFAEFEGMALDNNNNIILAGKSPFSSGFVIRITPQGLLDNTFGNQGIINLPDNINFSPKFNSIKIQSNNKIVIGGGNNINNILDYVLVRLNPNGTLDTTFGNNGISQIGLNNIDEMISKIEVLNDGKIMAIGYTSEGFGNGLQAVIMRFNSVGLLDPTFSGNGKYLTNWPVDYDMRGDIKMQTDGKFLFTFETTNDTFIVFRMNSNGIPDNNFGFGGYATSSLTGIERSTQLYYNPISQDITLIGTSLEDDVAKFSLARFSGNGFIDGSFGNSGWVITDLGNPAEAVSATATGDGKLVVSGYLYDEVLNDYDIVMAKYYINESLSLHNPNDVSIQLFPNPVSETLYVRMKNEATAENFKVTDMSGKVVLNGKLSLEQGIHVSALARGVYFISLDGYNPIRFIKQ